MPGGREHHIGRFEVTENDGRLAIMEVVEPRAELEANAERLLKGQLAADFVQVCLQGLTLDIVHPQVPAASLTKLLIKARQMGMRETRQQESFVLEGLGSLDQFARI